MLYPERDLGFESLTLRHRRHKLCIACDDFLCKKSSRTHAAAPPLPKKSADFSGTPISCKQACLQAFSLKSAPKNRLNQTFLFRISIYPFQEKISCPFSLSK